MNPDNNYPEGDSKELVGSDENAKVRGINMFDSDNKTFTIQARKGGKGEERYVYFLFQEQKIARADYQDDPLSFYFITYF